MAGCKRDDTHDPEVDAESAELRDQLDALGKEQRALATELHELKLKSPNQSAQAKEIMLVLENADAEREALRSVLDHLNQFEVKLKAASAEEGGSK